MATYTTKQLVSASGFPERSIRQYVLEGMVPRPKYRGKDTLYGDAQLIALRAIAKLRKEQRMFRLAPLRAWFAGKSASENRGVRNGRSGRSASARRSGGATRGATRRAAGGEERTTRLAAARRGGTWIHLPLVPGMTLLVRDGAPEVVTRLAGEIRAKYGV